MKRIIRVVVIFLASTLLFSFTTKSIYAAEGSDKLTSTTGFAEQTPLDWAKAIETNCGTGDPNAVCGEKYSYWSTQSIINGFNRLMIGMPTTGSVEGASTQAFNNSAVGFLARQMDTMVNNPPASSAEYIAYVMDHAGFATPAYAQGIGYSGLRPVLFLWRAMRNLAYVIIVIVLVVIGFMIMFRMQIDAQTVISVQNALPNIVVTLIVITFSYAIVGLLIDLMYFLIMFIVSYVGSSIGINQGAADSIQALQSYYVNANIGTIFGDYVFTEESWALPSAIFSALPAGARDWAGNIDVPFLQQFVQFLGVIVGGIGGFATGAIVWLLIALALFFSAIKIFVILLNSYIQVIIGVIIAPLQLLVGAIPGQNTFRNWLFSMIGNLIVFPTLVAILMLANAITTSVYSEIWTDPSGDLWSPPFLFGQTTEAGPMLSLFLVGLLMMTPTILTTVKGFFAPKPVLPISPGTLLKPTIGAGQSLLGLAQTQYYLRQLIPKKKTE